MVKKDIRRIAFDRKILSRVFPEDSLKKYTIMSKYIKIYLLLLFLIKK